MAIFPNGVIQAVKTALSGSSYLSYVETVAIRKYRPGNLPAFTHHAIVLSPSFVQAIKYDVMQSYIINSIHIHLLVDMTTYGEEASITGDSPASSPPNVGILAMYEDVFITLFDNKLGGAIEVIPGQSEFNEPSFFDVVKPEEGEGFIMEARLEYRPKGVRFIPPLT